jgi:HEPN domain-containing protein
MTSRSRPPLWGNFVPYADSDFLAFGVLNKNGLFVLAAYHGTQAIEKYLKALCLSIIDPIGTSATVETEKNWIMTHNLENLANRCSTTLPYFGRPDVLENLRRFSEFDQAARYPWVKQNHANGFTTDDIPIFGEIVLQLRQHIPIVADDYALGMEVRGFHQVSKEAPKSWPYYSHDAVEALREIFPNLNEYVRW